MPAFVSINHPKIYFMQFQLPSSTISFLTLMGSFVSPCKDGKAILGPVPCRRRPRVVSQPPLHRCDHSIHAASMWVRLSRV